jgi:hypothetical protein
MLPDRYLPLPAGKNQSEKSPASLSGKQFSR